MGRSLSSEDTEGALGIGIISESFQNVRELPMAREALEIGQTESDSS